MKAPEKAKKAMAEVKVEAEALCAKILKATGPQKQVVAMNALYMAMQVVDSVSWRDVKPPATCSYPHCNCPFDAPANPNWCARGLPHNAELKSGASVPSA